MKKTITILSLAFTAITANATVRTVSNNSNSPGQYTDLQAAVTAAANNDTLYVHGSQTSYGNVTITKPLTIIGAGALPNKDFYYATLIGNITLAYNGLYTSSASGSTIIGFDVTSISLAAGNGSSLAGISNVTITRNRINNILLYQSGGNGQSALAHSNISIYNNVISTIGGNGLGFIKNSTVRNNIITSISGIGSVYAGSWLLTNNIILSTVSGSSITISNNIFYHTHSSSAVNAITFCSLSNNSFYSTARTYVTSDIIYGDNNGNNNILNQDPLFVYYDPLAAVVDAYTQLYPVAGPFADFNLQAGSPCLLAGSDALDLGIYGGLSPFIEGYPANSRYRYFPMPAVPQMLQMNIQNAAILPAGTLNVNFKARKQH